MKSTLQLLSLSDNLVFTRGNLFNSYMGELTQLTRLEYANTNFINENGVPTEIGRLKNLNFYSCNQVRYAGALSSLAFPSDMTQLSEFLVLWWPSSTTAKCANPSFPLKYSIY